MKSVMTEEERLYDTPDTFAQDKGWDHFEVTEISHTHPILDEPDEQPHTHMIDTLKTGTYIEDDISNS